MRFINHVIRDINDAGANTNGKINAGEDVDPERVNFQHKFYEAVRRADVEKVKYFIKNRQVNIDEPDWDVSATPPLLEAAGNGNVALIKVLCENGCDPNVRSMRGETALHAAVSNRRLSKEAIETLVASGCKADVQENLGGETALHVFLGKHVVKKRNTNGGNDDVNDKELLKQLFIMLVEYSNVNIPDHRLRTPLQIVSSAKCDTSFLAELLQILLDRNPNLNLQNGRGETALHEALENNNKDLAVMLIKAKSDLSLETKYHETPLHIAARKNMHHVVKILLDYGCPVNVQDLNGNTALHLAASKGYKDVVNMLLRSEQILLNVSNKEGFTPLHLAVESGFIYVVELLLNADGCDLTAKTKRSETALDLAQQDYRRRSQPEMTEVLSREIQRRSSGKSV